MLRAANGQEMAPKGQRKSVLQSEQMAIMCRGVCLAVCATIHSVRGERPAAWEALHKHLWGHEGYVGKSPLDLLTFCIDLQVRNEVTWQKSLTNALTPSIPPILLILILLLFWNPLHPSCQQQGDLWKMQTPSFQSPPRNPGGNCSKS